ncbi:hypothetical protein FOC16_05510 [Salmonella enterica]|uniref:hypothetical protein n=1 Tax=Salmonella enterica TaxID=28901 RepID=UPI0012DEF853|nr:hypothetical protein [Salmonella enterica]QGR32381.1 hypothetical protein FOC16_05510 [Salmonella enterica]
MGYQAKESEGMCVLASVTEVMFAQGQNPWERSKADRDYVYARKRYKKGDFQVIDSMNYFFEIWTLYVRSPDILKHHFKNSNLDMLSGHCMSKIRTKCGSEVEK